MTKIDRINKLLTISETLKPITQDQFNSVDWKLFETEIVKVLKQKIDFNIQFKNNLLSITTKNLVDEAGILSIIYSKLDIISEGGTISKDKKWLEFNLYFEWKYSLGRTIESRRKIVEAHWHLIEKRWVWTFHP